MPSLHTEQPDQPQPLPHHQSLGQVVQLISHPCQLIVQLLLQHLNVKKQGIL